MKKTVDPTAKSINSALQEIWDTEQGGNRIKAALFNLITYTQNPKRIDYFKRVVNDVIQKFPCRIISIQANEKKGDYLETSVSTVQPEDSQGQIICDRILIEAGGKLLSQVPFLLNSLLIPDLPVHLLWGQDPTDENEIFPHLKSFASRVIFDSESSDHLLEFSERILHVMRKTPCEFVDMNWSRMSGWRNVLVQTFDSQERINDLKQATTIQISFNEIKNPWFEHQEIQALYFQTWLTSRLSLKKDQKIEMLPSKEDNLFPGSIVKVEIKTENGSHYKLTQTKNNVSQVRVEISTKEQCFLPFSLPLSTANKGLSFIKELLYTSPSIHYKEMLKALHHDAN